MSESRIKREQIFLRNTWIKDTNTTFTENPDGSWTYIDSDLPASHANRSVMFFDDDGNFHHLVKPASSWNTGEKSWYKHGSFHNENGPAIVMGDINDNKEYWYLDGIGYTFIEWKLKHDPHMTKKEKSN